MRKDTQQQRDWSGRMEQLEDRLVMSADPLGGLLGGSIQHHAIVDDLPPVQHQVVAEEPPAVEHHAIVDELPALNQHIQSEADFWIDSDRLRAIEEELGQIEQTLANAHDQSGLTQVRTDYGFDGTGQTVAVIDSGIAYDHFALGGGFGSNYRVVGGWDFTGENDADPYDDGGAGSHGTHVSGIIGANGGANSGVAPGVDLVGLRVFDDAGDGYFSWVEDALMWVHNNRNNFENPITAVNLSLGVASWNSDSIPSWANLENEFNLLKQDGIFISVSAGNSYTSFNTTGLSYPAASQYVVPVASVDDDGFLSYYSQRNSRVIAAPGRGIISTVPDYAGDNNGTTDDYASFSGTSMASPYVAGASVIIREAMEFVGYTNITQDTIYDHMVATADSFFDSATSAYYNRLNLETAIDALMTVDDYGSTTATAYNLGSISGTSAMSGAITTLDDVDYFKFTAASNGTVTFTASNMTHNVGADWDVTGGSSTWSGANNEILTVDVVAGQEYTVGFSSDDGLGYYDLDITAESSFSYTDWGTISFSQPQSISIAGESWFRVAANADGYFTAQALFDSSGGQINLELYNTSLQLIDSGNASGGESRVDFYGSVGDELYIKAIGTNSDVDFRLTNLVSVDGTTVNIAGTASADTFSFAAGSTHQVSVNGVTYSFASVSVTNFQFDGSGGSDTISMVGSSAAETAVLRVGQANFSSSTFAVAAIQIVTVTIDGAGGSDLAYLFDSAGDDILVTGPQSSQIAGSGFNHTALGFEMTYSFASAGGTDKAFLKDSAGNDSFVGTPTYARMSGTGFYNYTQGFDLVYAYSTAGGTDTATLYDSASNDVLVAYSTYARMSGSGFYNYTQGFEAVNAYSTAGGYDLSYLYDSAGNDYFTARPEYGRMSGTGFNNYSNGFDRVYAYATAGGTDLAYMYDSTGDDIFTARPGYGRLQGVGFYNQANGFDRVNAYAFNGGTDLAYLYDSAGDDNFVARPDYGRLSGSGFSNYAKAFDRVNAYATSGGNDTAYFYDSAGDDDFVARPDYGRITGADFNHYAKSFEQVHAYATAGGNDTATLYGSDTGTNTLVEGATDMLLSGDDFYSYASDFESLVALTHDGDPLISASAVDSVFEAAGA